MTAAMSWDVELMSQWGSAMGKEFRDKGANVLYGPAVNLHRVPTGGRNFEYLSGEDPFLGYTLVQPVVRGIQSQGVIANVKHFIDNNQEGLNGHGEDGRGDRHSTSSHVDERTQVEMYFPPYEGAVEAGVLSAMCGNNLINGEHACENNFTQNTLFRDWGGFQGFIVSDYRGSQTMLGAALGGLDIQLPGCDKPDLKDPTGLSCVGQAERPNVFGKPLVDAVRNGIVPMSVVDSKAENIVFALISSGAMDRNRTGRMQNNVTSLEHSTLARSIAVQSAVLLQNEGTFLPLDRAKVAKHKVSIIGAAGHRSPITGGGGSGSVVPAHQSTILDAVRAKVGRKAVTYFGGSNTTEASIVAASSGYAIVVLAASSKEGQDRVSLTLPDAALVKAVSAVQPNTVVVVASPGAFLAPWADGVPAILAVWMSGQEQGGAVAELLFGDSSPSGKLVLTIPNKENEVGFRAAQYPGVNVSGPCTLGFDVCYKADYTERLEVGYRWYHANGVTPHFPFGHGLTYSNFSLSNLQISGRHISASLRNVGQAAAAEVVQVYLTFPASAGEPARQLKGFSKVSLGPSEQSQVNFTLQDRDVSVWDDVAHRWVQVSGKFTVEVGTSSVDLPLSGSVTNAPSEQNSILV